MPADYDGYFGPPPNFTFLEVDQAAIIHNVRRFPRRETPEDTLRAALEQAGWPEYRNTRSALDHLLQLLDREGDIDGVIGYSEGARVAASLVLEEQRQEKEAGRMPLIKCALFIGGWQPIHPASAREIFADESDERITIPTCHIVGSSDPYIDGSLALYDLCDQDLADLFDHGGGHVLPREKQVVMELADVVRGTMAASQGE